MANTGLEFTEGYFESTYNFLEAVILKEDDEVHLGPSFKCLSLKSRQEIIDFESFTPRFSLEYEAEFYFKNNQKYIHLINLNGNCYSVTTTRSGRPVMAQNISSEKSVIEMINLIDNSFDDFFHCFWIKSNNFRDAIYLRNNESEYIFLIKNLLGKEKFENPMSPREYYEFAEN